MPQDAAYGVRPARRHQHRLSPELVRRPSPRVKNLRHRKVGGMEAVGDAPKTIHSAFVTSWLRTIPVRFGLGQTARGLALDCELQCLTVVVSIFSHKPPLAHGCFRL